MGWLVTLDALVCKHRLGHPFLSIIIIICPHVIIHACVHTGWDDVFDDPKMGWSRWAHSFHAFSLNSGLFYLVANERTIGLMDRITDRLMREQAWDQAVFNEEVRHCVWSVGSDVCDMPCGV